MRYLALFCCVLLLTVVLCPVENAASTEQVGKPSNPGVPRIQPDDGDAVRVTVDIQLPADALKNLPAGACSQDQGEAWLRFALLKKDGPGLPMIGSYQRKDDRLTFRPRYALEPGSVYRATFGQDKGAGGSADYRVPPRAATAVTTVVKILPGCDVLPANHLKFCIYFSAPMRGGKDIFEQIRILGADGQVVGDPWLRDELWNDDDQMLIIYIHPGRIKWGLLLREMLGPVLVPNKEFSLVVKGDMLDAKGQKLGKDYVKKFRTTAEERTRILLSQWKLHAPQAGTRKPLLVESPRALDHNGVHKYVTFKNDLGQEVAGTITMGKENKTWSFTPTNAWRAGEHTLHVDGRLEDVAGNTPLRAFDLDLQAPAAPPQPLELKFQIIR